MQERSKPRICLAVSDKPEGSFKGYRAPLFNYGWSAIDSHIFIDDQDKPYLYFAQVGRVCQDFMASLIQGGVGT